MAVVAINSTATAKAAITLAWAGERVGADFFATRFFALVLVSYGRGLSDESCRLIPFLNILFPFRDHPSKLAKD
jgi:hypothetical protein